MFAGHTRNKNIASYVMHTILDGSHTPPVTEADSLKESDPDISMDTVSTGVDSDMEDQVFAVGTHCDHPMCVYYGNTGMSKVIKQYYRCQKCSSVEDGNVMDIFCACITLVLTRDIRKLYH